MSKIPKVSQHKELFSKAFKTKELRHDILSCFLGR